MSCVEGFTRHTGRIAVFDLDNVDTDRIIPARFLSMVTRSGYGELLFKDIRGAGFPLDQPEAAGASILVAGCNFGSGSSREHAVWALQQAGYRAIVARRTAEFPGYSDIFRQNAANCGLLLVELPDDQHAHLVQAGSGAEATVDLTLQQVILGSAVLSFDIDPSLKAQIMEGLDLIGATLRYGQEIEAFESKWESFAPREHVSKGGR